MSARKWASLALLASFGVIAGCDRLALESKNTLQISIAKNSESTPFATQRITRLAVNVTAADLKEPLQVLLSSEMKSSPSNGLAAEATLEVPSGKDRLIQLIAVYEDSTGKEILRYGDIIKTLTPGTSEVSIPLQSVAENIEVDQSKVRGRFLSTNTSGPSEELLMIYRPAGKPGITVDRSWMINGWFQTTVLKDVPMDYITATGVVIGEQWKLASLTPSKNLVQLHFPLTYRQEFLNGTHWKTEKPQNHFLGFFARDNTFLTDKKICVATSGKKGSSITIHERYLSEFWASPISVKFFLTGSSPVFSDFHASFMGGVPKDSCLFADPAEEYLKYFIVSDTYTTHGGSDLILAQMAGIQGPLASIQINSDFRQAVAPYADVQGIYNFFKFLPGTSSGTNGYSIYSKIWDPLQQQNIPSCRQLPTTPGFTFEKSEPLMQDELTVRASHLSSLSPQKYFYLCLSKDGHHLNEPIEFYLPNLSTAPADQVHLSMPSFQVPVGDCFPVNVSLNSTTAHIPYNDTPLGTMQISSDSGDVRFFSTADCSSSGVTSYNFKFNRFSAFDSLWVKTTTPGTFTLFADFPGAAQGSLAINSYNKGTTVSWINLDGQFGYFGAEGCFPLKINAFDSSGDVATAPAGGSVDIQIKKSDGATPSTLPTGTFFVDSCLTKNSLGTNLNIANQSSYDFALVTGAIPLLNTIITFKGNGSLASLAESPARFNFAPLAYKLIAEPVTPAASMNINSCLEFKVKAVDSNNLPLTIPAGEKLYFNFSPTEAIPGSLSFFSANDCSSNSHEFAISGGQSEVSAFAKVDTSGTYGIHYYSSQTRAWVNPSLSWLTFTAF